MIIDANKIEEFNEIKDKIEKLDDDFEKEAVAKANFRALQDNNNFVPGYMQSNNTVTFGNGGHITKEQHTK